MAIQMLGDVVDFDVSGFPESPELVSEPSPVDGRASCTPPVSAEPHPLDSGGVNSIIMNEPANHSMAGFGISRRTEQPPTGSGTAKGIGTMRD
jgi:hypothetical protein